MTIILSHMHLKTSIQHGLKVNDMTIVKTSHVSYHSSEENNIIKKRGYIEYPYFFNLSSIC